MRQVKVAGTNCKMDHKKFEVNTHIKLNESNPLHESILYPDLEENHNGDLFYSQQGLSNACLLIAC